MTVYNESASSFETLRNKLKTEFLKRDANGSIKDVVIGKNAAVSGENIDDMSGTDLINNALMIADIDGLAFVEQGDILPDISLLETALNKWSGETKTGSSSCRGYCTGLCQGSCSGGCVSCTGNCSQTCGASCGNTCVTACSRTCGGTCSTTCGKSCTGSCGGCSGCSGCSGGCNNACSGCSTTTKAS